MLMISFTRGILAVNKSLVIAKRPLFSLRSSLLSSPNKRPTIMQCLGRVRYSVPSQNQQSIVGGGKALASGNVTKKIFKQMFDFVWPTNKPHVKIRVCVALGLLLASKLLNVYVPFIFKDAIDFLNKNTALKDFDDTTANRIMLTAFALMIGYGVARASSSLFSELRNAIFATVAQGSIRDLARSVFAHLHGLDLSFHLSRQTGALSKVIGNYSFSNILFG
jgi:hypothetical protein